MSGNNTQQDPPTARGFRPGDVPASIDWPVGIWLIRHPSESGQPDHGLQQIESWARRSEYSVTQVHLLQTRDPDGSGLLRVLDARNVYRLYTHMHRARVGVFTFAGTRVVRDASERPSRRGSTPLEQFVAGKAFYAHVTRTQEVSTAISRCEAWVSRAHCAKHTDDTALPHHVLRTKSKYGDPIPRDREGWRVDETRRVWKIGPCHTMDLLQVAGLTIPIGFHWDVHAQTSTSVLNGWQRWRLPGGKYTNIHPNAHVRGGAASKEFDALKPTPGRESPRTPRHKRSRKR